MRAYRKLAPLPLLILAFFLGQSALLAAQSMEGYQAFVIQNDGVLSQRIEYYAVIHTEVDCNQKTLQGDFHANQEVPNSIIFKSEGKILSTLMACFDEVKMGWVKGGSQYLILETGKEQIVYVPVGMELRYKIWSPVISAQRMKADPGAPYLESFPEAEKGKKRHLFYSNTLHDAKNLMIEFFGRIQVKKDCNSKWVSGRFQQATLKGWGGRYWTLDGGIGTTYMACPDAAYPMMYLNTESLFEPYNDKLPTVVYTPDNWEMYYRVWQGGKEVQPQLK